VNDLLIFEGIVGLTYWYQVKADCSIWGIKPSNFDDDNMLAVAQTAFQFALTDNLKDDNERALIIVNTELYIDEPIREMNSIEKRSLPQITSDIVQQSDNLKKVYNKHDSSIDEKGLDVNITELIHAQIDTWIPSLALAENIAAAFDR
jgi:hypothetical protein